MIVGFKEGNNGGEVVGFTMRWMHFILSLSKQNFGVLFTHLGFHYIIQKYVISCNGRFRWRHNFRFSFRLVRKIQTVAGFHRHVAFGFNRNESLEITWNLKDVLKMTKGIESFFWIVKNLR